MKKKLVWLIVSCLMVVALVLASCAPAVVEEKEVKGVVKEPEKKAEEVVEKPAVGEPQYGGKLTIYNARIAKEDPPSPDVADGFYIATEWLVGFVQEVPILGDFEKYGPRGTGESLFHVWLDVPDKFLKGHLLESWEVSPERIVYHVRPGIMWHGDKPHVMETRELTAEDIVADLLYLKASPWGWPGWMTETGDIYATDKYTLVIEFVQYDPTWIRKIGRHSLAMVSPPELVAAGQDKWENQVGTGPFMFKEYVIGAYMAFERNPNYWKTTTINGVEYQLPFIDRVVMPIIPDEATAVAALRTGKLDYYLQLPPVHWDGLGKTTPELVNVKVPRSGVSIALNCVEPPFDDVKIRRAMLIGTDMKEFQPIYGVTGLPLHFYPLSYLHPETLYTPLEDLPPESRLLYDYNPDLAKQMLAEAGYPDGFKIDYNTQTDPYSLDAASMLKYQWDKIGVEVKINALDPVAFAALAYNYPYTYPDGFSVGGPYISLSFGETGSKRNHSLWSDPHYDELVAKIKAELDSDEQDRLMKEAFVYLFNAATRVPLTYTMTSTYWWPWLKNYYGEINVGDHDHLTPLSHAWLDLDLKKEMGH